MFRRVAKIPISKTAIDLSGMDFPDYGDRGHFAIYRILFSRDSVILRIGDKEKVGRAADKVANAILEQRVDFFGTPGIFSADKDAWFNGATFAPIL